MIERYSRQILFSGIGEEGQRRLGSSCVVIIGCGALGTIIAIQEIDLTVHALEKIAKAGKLNVKSECAV